MANEQINVPSLVVILVLSGLIIRYLFFSPGSGSGSGSGSGVGSGSGSGGATTREQRQREREAQAQAAAARAREAAVERIQQMFPQVERRVVLWDLQRTGGSIAATTERILAGRLETPPITFQPPPPPAPANGSTAGSGSGSSSSKPADKPAQPDLITRYHLQDKVTQNGQQGQAQGQGSDSADSGKGKGKATATAVTATATAASAQAWSSNREERQVLLQRRRDQMILEARRKMEAKMAAEKAAGAS